MRKEAEGSYHPKGKGEEVNNTLGTIGQIVLRTNTQATENWRRVQLQGLAGPLGGANGK